MRNAEPIKLMGEWKGEGPAKRVSHGCSFGRSSSSVNLKESIKVKKEVKYWKVKKR